MKKTKLNILILLILVISLLVPGLTASAQSDDVIGDYLVDITPQSDGTLIIKYQFENYCASTDFPVGDDYLEVGVPNRNFEILEYGPSNWIKSVNPMTSGGSWVHLEFLGHPVTGDCFDFYFVIKQSAMAYPSGENVTLEFSQGTFSFAEISHLQITWHLPSDPALIVSLSPQPEVVDNNTAVWNATNLAPDEEYGISVIFAKAAFPDLQVAQPPQIEAPSSTDGGSSSGAGFLIFIICVVVVIIVILVVTYISVTNDNSDTYTGPLIGGTGSHTGSGNTYHQPTCACACVSRPSTPSTCACVSRPSTPSCASRPSSSGSGSSAGRGSSCASSCVKSCACACASSGGRAGCTKKYGYFIARLFKLGHKA